MAIDIDAIVAAVQAAQLVKDKDLKPAPQSFDSLLSKFVPLLSDNGAARQVLYGPDGNPISTADGKLAVKASDLEALLTALKGKDFATETKLEAVRVLLNSLAGEDFATSAKQAEMLAALGKQSTADKQDTLAALVGAIDAAAVSDPAAAGAVIALLKGVLSRLQALGGKLDGITDGTTPATTKSTGSKVKNAFEIIPDDATDLSHETIAVYVGFDGDLKVDLVGGDTVTMYNLAAGAWHPIQAKRVYATGTAATYILGAY